MIRHYLTLAFRNLWKYRTQNAVSIVGLAVGFTSFALATLWIHYETTYDSDVPSATHLYALYNTRPSRGAQHTIRLPYPLSSILTSNLPEVEKAGICYYEKDEKYHIQTDEGISANLQMFRADSCFMDMFGIKLLAGSLNFLHNPQFGSIAMTDAAARRLFGTTDVLGKEVTISGRWKVTISALVSGLPHHSNFSFDYMLPFNPRDLQKWEHWRYRIFVRLRQGVDAEAFDSKISPVLGKTSHGSYCTDLHLLPLTQYHYSPQAASSIPISFQYLVFFSIAGALVMFSALGNYLLLFIARIRMRLREVELRRVCGSSRRSLFALFTCEFLLYLGISGLLGFCLIELILPWFRRMSGVEGGIYRETFVFYLVVLILSLLILSPFICRKSSFKTHTSKHTLRKTALVYQIFIGLLFAFCTSVVMKQLYYLTEGDLGWDKKNTGVLYLDNGSAVPAVQADLEQIPSLEMQWVDPGSLFPGYTINSRMVKEWSGKESSNQDSIQVISLENAEKLIKMYRMKLLDGRIPAPEETDKVIINETLARKMGMQHPVGNTLVCTRDNKGTASRIIAGLVKDFHVGAATAVTSPYILFPGEVFGGQYEPVIELRAHEGMWKQTEAAIDSLLAKKYPKVGYELSNIAEAHDSLLYSEQFLLKLLTFAAFVCILIAAFGIFSFVTLSCEQRRKEIAIRKVNGARVGDILALFGREHLWLLLAASIIAFSIGYALMKRWMEQYTERTPISAWLYLVIFLGAALLIALCIGWRVWQAARSNPADTIKRE
jgi:ABC-type antimicrobial peptide transport system permease subunit